MKKIFTQPQMKTIRAVIDGSLMAASAGNAKPTSMSTSVSQWEDDTQNSLTLDFD